MLLLAFFADDPATDRDVHETAVPELGLRSDPAVDLHDITALAAFYPFHSVNNLFIGLKSLPPHPSGFAPVGKRHLSHLPFKASSISLSRLLKFSFLTVSYSTAYSAFIASLTFPDN